MLTFYSDTELTPSKTDVDNRLVEPDEQLLASLDKIQPINTSIHGRYYKPPYG